MQRLSMRSREIVRERLATSQESQATSPLHLQSPLDGSASGAISCLQVHYLLKGNAVVFFDSITNRSTVQSTVKAKDRRGNEHLLFHGTNRACLLGEIGNNVVLCSLQDCSLCSILRTSFDVKRCGKSNVICCSYCSVSLLPKALRMHSSGM